MTNSWILRTVLSQPRMPLVTDVRDMLKVKAGRVATARLHRLGGWINHDDYRASAVCEVCGKEAYVDGKPAPNGIDVSGEVTALDCSRDSVRRIRISYDIVTPDSAEFGDFEETGWENEEGEVIDPDDCDVEFYGSESAAAIELAVYAIGNDVETSDWPTCCPGHTWYTQIDGDEDYEDGSVKRLSYHLDGFSEEEECAIYTALTGR